MSMIASLNKEGKLVLVLDVNNPLVPSVSGKTRVVASTHGNIPTTVMVEGKPVIVGVNAYIK